MVDHVGDIAWACQDWHHKKEEDVDEDASIYKEVPIDRATHAPTLIGHGDGNNFELVLGFVCTTL